MQWWFEHQRDVIRFEFFGTFLLSTVVHCHCDDTTQNGLQVFTILFGNATRMMRFKGRQEGEEFHVEMRRVVVKRGREAGRQQGQWSRRGGPANRQTNISLWTQRSISPRRERYFLDPDLGILIRSTHYGRGGRRHWGQVLSISCKQSNTFHHHFIQTLWWKLIILVICLKHANK